MWKIYGEGGLGADEQCERDACVADLQGRSRGQENAALDALPLPFDTATESPHSGSSTPE